MKWHLYIMQRKEEHKERNTSQKLHWKYGLALGRYKHMDQILYIPIKLLNYAVLEAENLFSVSSLFTYLLKQFSMHFRNKFSRIFNKWWRNNYILLSIPRASLIKLSVILKKPKIMTTSHCSCMELWSMMDLEQKWIW